jgi:hypothetical protein
MNNSLIKDNVSNISKWILIFLCVLSLFEMVFYPEIENIYGCGTFIIGWLFLHFFVMKYRNAKKCFLPFISLFGLGICFYFMPLFKHFTIAFPISSILYGLTNSACPSQYSFGAPRLVNTISAP